MTWVLYYHWGHKDECDDFCPEGGHIQVGETHTKQIIMRNCTISIITIAACAKCKGNPKWGSDSFCLGESAQTLAWDLRLKDLGMIPQAEMRRRPSMRRKQHNE